VALTPDGARAFTTNVGAGTVSEIDVRARRVTRTDTVGTRVEGIAVTPDGGEVWVGGNTSQTVYVIDTHTGKVAHTLAGLGMPYRIGITPDGSTAVISDPGAEKIHIVDAKTHAVRSVIDVPAENGTAASPQGVRVADDRTAFVTLKGAAKVA